MSDLEQLIRGALAEDAESQPVPTNLVSIATRRGRQLRRLRRASVGALASAAAVSAVVFAINAVVPSGRSVPTVGSASGSSAPSSEQPTLLPTEIEETPANWKEQWPTGRVFDAAASPTFLAKVAPGEQLTVYASGHAPDGSTFVMYTTPGDPTHPRWEQGVDSTTVAFGDDGEFSCNGQCNVFEFPTVQTHEDENMSATQWLVLSTMPGVLAVSYSPDGNSWQPMDFRDGIALLPLPGIAPWNAELHLTLSNGQTVESMLSPGRKPAPAGSPGPADLPSP
ncbi:MAG: hypothetical protein ACRDV3_09150 [Acidothermaceae bacterium]